MTYIEKIIELANKISEYAKIFKVEKQLRPYLEVL
jgi:hypothetical protein